MSVNRLYVGMLCVPCVPVCVCGTWVCVCVGIRRVNACLCMGVAHMRVCESTVGCATN